MKWTIISVLTWRIDDDSISSSDRAEYWLERTRFLSALLCLSETFGLGGTWGLLEEAERLGYTNPSTSTRTPYTLTLEGERLEGDESSFEAAVFKGTLRCATGGSRWTAEPLDAILWGLGETPRGPFGGIGWTPICLRRTFSGLARNPGVGRYRPRLPGGSLSAGRYRSGSARRTHIRLRRPKWTF